MKECQKCLENTIKKERVWCETCEHNFTLSGTKYDHDSTILHQFNYRQKDADDPKDTPHYYIANSNKGYKLLKKSGWDEQSGLGPSGEGSKFPVKTVLKRDRLGLGSEVASRPRVTHFGSHDTSAVKRYHKKKEKTDTKLMHKLNKKRITVKEHKQKQSEIDFRLSFNTE